MKTISIINLKGGVGKTITVCNMAHILASVHNKRVLIIDNDKQGNASKLYSLHGYGSPSVADVLTVKDLDISKVIKHTHYDNLDLITANMMLVSADLQLKLDTSSPQLTRLKTALKRVEGNYDYCIIDNAPDINMYTMNALVASDEYIIPLTIDNFALDGLKVIFEQIENIREFNNKINFKGILITQWQNNDTNRDGEMWLKEQKEYCTFNTHIRKTEKICQSTFAEQPILIYSKTSAAARDYLKFTEEYLNR